MPGLVGWVGGRCNNTDDECHPVAGYVKLGGDLVVGCRTVGGDSALQDANHELDTRCPLTALIITYPPSRTPKRADISKAYIKKAHPREDMILHDGRFNMFFLIPGMGATYMLERGVWVVATSCPPPPFPGVGGWRDDYI